MVFCFLHVTFNQKLFGTYFMNLKSAVLFRNGTVRMGMEQIWASAFANKSE